MANELRTICDLLDGYTEEKKFEVLAATKTADGKWELTIKKVEPETKKPEEAEIDY